MLWQCVVRAMVQWGRNVKRPTLRILIHNSTNYCTFSLYLSIGLLNSLYLFFTWFGASSIFFSALFCMPFYLFPVSVSVVQVYYGNSTFSLVQTIIFFFSMIRMAEKTTLTTAFTYKIILYIKV